MIQTIRLIIVLLLVFTGEAVGQTASFTASQTTGCAPQVVYFTNSSSAGATSYSWNFGNGATSVLKNPSTTYTSPGTYNVTLTVSFGSSYTSTTSSTIVVYDKPAVTFTVAKTTGCRPHSAAFTSTVTPNAPGPVSYLWSFGDGHTDTAANPTNLYTVAGTYAVSLTVTNGSGCATTVTMPAFIKVLGNNPITASPLTSCAAPVNVNFSTPSLSGVTTSWLYGDGSSGTGNSSSHTYAASGTYTVTMMQYFSSVGCTDTVTRPSYILVRGRTSNFSAPSATCVNSLVTFSNLSPSNWASWDFGDGRTAYGFSIQHSYSAAGTYIVRMITTIGNCPDTAFKTIVVNATPNPVINVSPQFPCPPPATLTFSASGVPTGSTYSWSWRSGGTSATSSPTKSYSSAFKRDTVMLMVTTPGGCTGYAIKDSVVLLNILPKMKVRERPSEGCVPLTIHFDSAWLETDYPDSNDVYPAPITSYTWDFGDGSAVSHALSTTHTYTAYGIFIASVTMTTANGCSAMDTIHVHAGTKIPPAYAIVQDSLCISPGQLLQNLTSPPAPLYSWSFGPGGAPPWMPHSTYQIVKVVALGAPRVYLVSKNNGCKDTVSHIVKTIGTGAAFASEIQCPPSLDVVFTNVSIGFTSLQWDFGDGTTSTSLNPVITHTYARTGTYICRLSTYDAVTGCTDTAVDTFVVGRPRSSLFVSDTTLCGGQKVSLIGSVSGGAPIGYSWAVDDVTLRKRDTATHLWLSFSPGYHTITFRDTFLTYGTDTLKCVDSIRRFHHIFVSNPIASFSALPPLGCAPMSAIFTNNSVLTPGAGLVQLKWDYGDGGKDSGVASTYQHTYLNAGSYTVQLTALDSNGCTSVTSAVVESRKMTAAFSVNRTLACMGDTLNFTGATSTGAYPLKYLWFFGDGSSSTLPNPTHAYAAPGSYMVSLVATDSVSGCADTLRRANYISITQPQASFALSDTFGICAPLVVHFTSTSATAGVSTYSWTFGDGNSSPLAIPVNTYAAPGIFLVRLIVTDAAGCVDTSAIDTVRVLGYAGALTYKPLVGCEPLTVNFRALVTNAPSLVWDFSDGVTANASGDTISHTYLTRGAYVPKLIFSNNAGCTSSSVGLDTIKVDGLTAGFKTSPPCEHSFTTFYDTSHGTFLQPILSMWRFDSGLLKTGNPTNWVYPKVGEYEVTLITANWNNCRDSITKRITVLPLPVVTASNDTVVCVPDAVPLAADGATSYAWAPGSSLSCANCRTPMAAPTKPTAFIVTGTDTNGCANTDTVVVGIKQKTSVNTQDSGEVCAGQPFRLHASGATLYHWSPDSTLSQADTSDPIARPLKSTTYFVVAKKGSCIADTQKVRVTVNPLPQIDAGKDERIIAGNPTQLQGSGTNIHDLLWSPDSVLSCNTCYSPVARPLMTTTFYLRAYSTKGCEATDSVTIRVLCDGSQLFIPNTFTPNGDGLNDYFFPRGKGIPAIESIRVFSRWGELLFQRENFAANDEYAGWDGTVKGRALPPDVYVYLIVASCGAGEHVTLKGDITLMR